jgi:predicted nucleic acid-binding protein
VIVLDTNVLSELIKPTPNDVVTAWLDRQPRSELASTAISLLEMRTGATILPDGRRRAQLLVLIDQLFAQMFGSDLLPFDGQAALAFSEIVAERRRAGRPIGTMDAMIAAVARTRKAAVATRDVAGFDGCGVPLIDPWLT